MEVGPAITFTCDWLLWLIGDLTNTVVFPIFFPQLYTACLALSFLAYMSTRWLTVDIAERPMMAVLGIVTSAALATFAGTALLTHPASWSWVTMNLYRSLTLAAVFSAGMMALLFVIYGLLRLVLPHKELR